MSGQGSGPAWAWGPPWVPAWAWGPPWVPAWAWGPPWVPAWAWGPTVGVGAGVGVGAASGPAWASGSVGVAAGVGVGSVGVAAGVGVGSVGAGVGASVGVGVGVGATFSLGLGVTCPGPVRGRRAGGVEADEERVDGNDRMPSGAQHDDGDPVRSHGVPRLLEQHTRRAEGGRPGVHGRSKLAVDVDPGLAAGRTDRPDPGHRGPVEPERGLGLAGLRCAGRATKVVRVARGGPSAPVGDLAVGLLVDVDRWSPPTTWRGASGPMASPPRRPRRPRCPDGQEEAHEREGHDNGGDRVAEATTVGCLRAW